MGGGYKNKKQSLSHPPLQPPCPHALKACLSGRLRGGKLHLDGLSSRVARLPSPLPARRSPSYRPLGGRPPSALVSRCLQATEPQSAHCPAGAGRPAGPWRRITLRPTPVRESFPVLSLGYKIHFLRVGERLKIRRVPSLLQLSSSSLFRFSERGRVKRMETGGWPKM